MYYLCCKNKALISFAVTAQLICAFVFLYAKYLFTLGKQAVVVSAIENQHMPEDLIMEPGLVMIFAHGVE